MNDHINDFNNFINEDYDDLKQYREKILEYIGHNNWNVVIRKLNKQNFSDYKYRFEKALRNIKVSHGFIDKYKDLDLFPSFMNNVLDNNNYSESELIEIIEKFPDYISWYHIFYNENIPLWYKKQNYDKIYNDTLKHFDIRVPMEVRKENTEKALSILK